MSSRNRGRNTSNQDADEERRLWKEIEEKMAEVTSKVTRSHEIGREIIDLEQQIVAKQDADQSSKALEERLELLYRENIALCDDVTKICSGQSNDTNILDCVDILAGLKEASEESAAILPLTQGSRTASGKLSRVTKKAGPKGGAAAVAPALSTEEGDEAVATPSPRVSISGPASRLSAKEKSSRAGSIPATREASVKIEDGAESVASSADGATSTATGPTKPTAGSRPSNRLILTKGEIVFCRHDPKNYDPRKGEPPEGEGILCRVTSVIGEGKQRRYEVQDADVSSYPPPPQRASIAQLVQIPESNKGLPDLMKGKQVLAQYPDTTTFYKAEVNENWKARDVGHGEKGDLVKLNFQDDESPREVERRFVLIEK